MKLTGTNRPITYTTHFPGRRTDFKRFPATYRGRKRYLHRVHYVVPGQQPSAGTHNCIQSNHELM